MKKDCKQVWENCLNFIKDNISDKKLFDTWFNPLEPLKLEDDILTLKVPSMFFYEFIEENYIDVLKAAIRKELGHNAQLLYSVVMDTAIKNTTANPLLPSNNLPATQNFAQNIPVSIDSQVKDLPNPFVIPGLRKVKVNSQLNENYSFENFVEGSCNQLARSAGYAVAQNPGKTSFNPLFIHGSVGLGKTHLLHAIGLETKKKFPEKTVLYISAEQFFQQFVESTKNNTRNDFLQFYQMMIDVLIIDDIQFFANKTGTQEVFFQIFNGLHAANKQLIITSDKSPAELSGLEQRVISRLKWGLSADLQMPDAQTRIEIIEKKLFKDGISMPKDVIEYLAYNINSSVRELEGALISLIARSSITKQEITLDLAKDMIDKFVKSNSKEISIEYIQKVVCDYFNIPIDTMLSKTRKGEVVAARHISMFLSRKHTQTSLATIGSKCGNKDHATVLHACRSVQNSCDTDKKFRANLEAIEKKLTE